MSFCVQGLKLLKQPKNKISFHRHFNSVEQVVGTIKIVSKACSD